MILTSTCLYTCVNSRSVAKTREVLLHRVSPNYYKLTQDRVRFMYIMQTDSIRTLIVLSVKPLRYENKIIVCSTVASSFKHVHSAQNFLLCMGFLWRIRRVDIGSRTRNACFFLPYTEQATSFLCNKW